VERFSQRDEVELMYEDESWFSRYAMPRLRSHGPRGKRTRIPKREAPKSQPQKAVAVYGALTIPEKHICIQCVDEQPRSETTWRFLGSLVDYARRNHRRWLVVIWDNAGFHTSKRLTEWIRRHNRAQSGRSDGVRIVPYRLPTRSPWLNPIEPHWLHCKRAAYSVAITPTPEEIKRSVYRYFETKRPTGFQAA
jgi:transposase